MDGHCETHSRNPEQEMQRTTILTSTILLLALSAARGEELIFDNGDPSLGYGVAVLSELNAHNQAGDDVAIDQSVWVERIEWWGTGEGNSFRLRGFRTRHGLPESTPRIDLNLGEVEGREVSFGGGPVYEYSVDLPRRRVPAGEYAISIVEQGAGIDWFWSASCEDGCESASFRRVDDADEWGVGNWEMAFRIYGTLPNRTAH
ncbi:MAG: hypothetical protein CME06_02105 [Gemmatimonadetes bacterium]|nr:hypothetical protein [Gemmatimonadota bacterium]